MILSISGNQTVESETDLILVNKLNEVISEVNNIEAKLQSTSSTNTSVDMDVDVMIKSIKKEIDQKQAKK